MLFQKCFLQCFSGTFQGSFKATSDLLQFSMVLRVIRICFNCVSGLLELSFIKVLRVFRKVLKGVLILFQELFKIISRGFVMIFLQRCLNRGLKSVTKAFQQPLNYRYLL